MSGSDPDPRPWVSSRPMWSLMGASQERSCWMSVWTAMNSTCEMPASIIRLTAFRPPPPTPTTRMTARYVADSGRGARWMRGASTMRAAGGSTGAEVRTGASAAPTRSGAASSTVGASGAASPRSAWRCAASVARKSSASGPSRMLARRRAIDHLLRQVAVQHGGFAGRIVREDRLPLDRGLGVPDRLADPGVVDELAEVLDEDVDGLPR